IIAAPIITIKNEVVGVIQLLNRGHGSFNDEDKKLLNLITSQASLAILNAHNYRKKLERKRLKAEMRELNLNVLKGIRLKEIAQNLENMFREVVTCTGALLFYFDEQSNSLIFTKDPSYSIFLSTDGCIAEAIGSQQCLNIDEETIEQIQPIVEQEIFNGIAMPLLDFPTEDCIGLLIAYNEEDGSFASDAVEVIKQFLPEIAIMLRHSLAYEELMNKLS
ncbi:MAG: GAF domain-containing protein, partial [Chlamydiota bacterium]